MLLSAIDIGSNAVRLFFSHVFEQDGQIVAEKASLMRVPIRLGEDVFNNHHISEEKILKLIKTMQAFKLLIEVAEPVACRACATSAMREAKNKDEVINRISKKSGIQIEIIDGVEEAKIVSAVQNLDMVKNFNYSLFIDVGGGSTELSLMSTDGILESASFKIGTVRMLSGTVKGSEWEKMQDWLQKLNKNFQKILCVGSGGNVNKLAKLYGRVPEKTLPFTNLEYAINDLKKYTLRQRIEIMGLRPDRADVIIPAGEIFYFIMKTMNVRLLLVPKIGLSDGIVSMMYREIKQTQKK
ncbi:MAG: exopolyphosphatase [Bacteroidetes bacterium]|nr:MAG: exopolyphosphatase [Bacteroidota bacterium]